MYILYLCMYMKCTRRVISSAMMCVYHVCVCVCIHHVHVYCVLRYGSRIHADCNDVCICAAWLCRLVRVPASVTCAQITCMKTGVRLTTQRRGHFHGQMREICGVGHAWWWSDMMHMMHMICACARIKSALPLEIHAFVLRIWRCIWR
jgi:hypothetical protein